MLLNIPNSLTILRISLIPCFVVLFYLPWQWHYLASTVIFMLASLTDYLDGFLARKLRQESKFGTFLDPVADKLIIIVALILLVEKHANVWFTVPALIIVCREIIVSALREWMAEIGRRAQIKVSWLGKLKTSCQMLAIIILLAIADDNIEYALYAYSLLYIAVLLTIWSMSNYLISFTKSAFH